jgi:coproporphyrinogen III oxidase-like Fe-S oxidoreductase
MNNVEKDKEVTACVEQLLPQQVRLEKIMLGLRRSTGIALHEMFQGLTPDEQNQLGERVDWLVEHKFVQENAGRLVLTPNALALENEIVLKLSL